MKFFSLFLAALFCISCATTLPPAKPSTSMMDQADKVIITIDTDPEIAYQRLVDHLKKEGFKIIYGDINSYTLRTNYQTFGPLFAGMLGSYSMRISANVDGDKIFFSGQLSSGTEIENSGSKSSAVRTGWEKLVELANAFPHIETFYERN